jgi:2-dehydro-3-deoxy-D-arabinonate dehydratase
MKLVRFYIPGQGARLGQQIGETVYDLSSFKSAPATLTDWLQTSAAVPGVVWPAVSNLDGLAAYPYADLDRAPSPEAPHLLPPVDRQEVWAAGVTYAWSREARVREATSKEIYVKVYEAERPELFFKALPEKVVGPHDWVGIRGDSQWNVPEPELALVLNPKMQIVGFTVGNDMSSRDIEGENPLYLPQAKVYRHSCALGPTIAVADEWFDATSLEIQLTIQRDGSTVFQGETNTEKIHRSLDELAGYLGRYNDFPYGAVLLTGTGIVPGDDFTLADGDVVSIEIEGIGVLNNPVRRM